MREAGRSANALIVGQDGICAPVGNRAGACIQAFRAVTNRRRLNCPQLPSIRFRETMWRHWIMKRGDRIYEESRHFVFDRRSFCGGYGYGRWYAKPAPAAPAEASLLGDPCIPGISPISRGSADCGMKLFRCNGTAPEEKPARSKSAGETELMASRSGPRIRNRHRLHTGGGAGGAGRNQIAKVQTSWRAGLTRCPSTSPASWSRRATRC